MSFSYKGLAAGAVLLALAAGYFPAAPAAGVFRSGMAQAQNLGQRSVAGRVLAGEDVPALGATVFLKNLKTKAIRSYTTDKLGHFRFTQVDMSVDHELWAEKDGKKTAVKTISSWDARKEVQVEILLK